MAVVALEKEVAMLRDRLRGGDQTENSNPTRGSATYKTASRPNFSNLIDERASAAH